MREVIPYSVLTDIINDMPLPYIFAGLALALVLASVVLISVIGYITVRPSELREYSKYLKYNKHKKKQHERS